MLNVLRLAQKEGSPEELADKVYRKEQEDWKKTPIDPDAYKTAIADSIVKVRQGLTLENMGIDFPNTGFETDPICRSCRTCLMRDVEEINELFDKRKIMLQ